MRRIEVPQMFCEECGGEIARRYFVKRGPKEGHSRGPKRGIRFCSTRCSNLSRGAHGFIDKNGYHVLSGGTRNKQVMAHRVVMEGVIGRPLLSHETVHHINGQRADNRPENLELFSGRHCKGSRVSDHIVWAKETLALYGDLPFSVEHIEHGRADLLQAFPHLSCC